MSLALHALPDLQRDLLRQHAAALRQHMTDCSAHRSPWALTALLAETAHTVLAPRFVTTVGVACGLLALGLGWL